jgi:hypothetical protein
MRTPLQNRILAVVAVAIVASGLIAAVGARHATVAGIVVTLACIALTAFLGFRQFALAAIVQGDELVVRNFWTAHRISTWPATGSARRERTLRLLSDRAG